MSFFNDMQFSQIQHTRLVDIYERLGIIQLMETTQVQRRQTSIDYLGITSTGVIHLIERHRRSHYRNYEDITLRYQRAVGTTEYINLYRHIVQCQDPIWYVYTVNNKYVIINIRTLYEGIEHNLIDFQVKTNRDETSSFAIFSLNSLRDIHAVIFEGNI